MATSLGAAVGGDVTDSVGGSVAAFVVVATLAAGASPSSLTHIVVGTSRSSLGGAVSQVTGQSTMLFE